MSGEAPPELERRRVVFHGRVQGVFFRATAVELSREFDVTGYARNLPDGTVEMETQGPPDQIDGLLAAVRRHYERNITDVTSTTIPAREDESAFEIRY